MSALKKCLQIEGLSIINAADTLSDKDVTLDFNHPMAGKRLNFDVELLDIK